MIPCWCWWLTLCDRGCVGVGRYQHHYLTAGPVADMDLRICGTLYHRRIRNQRTLVREFIPGPAREMPPVQVR